jgi:hypothetical protein
LSFSPKTRPWRNGIRGLEVAPIDHREVHGGQAPVLFTGSRDREADDVQLERHPVGETHRGDPGLGRHSSRELSPERRRPPVVVALQLEIEGGHHHSLGFESEVDAVRVREAPHGQASADEEDEAEGHLARHQRAAKGRPEAERASTLPEAADHVSPGGGQGGNESEDDPRERGCADREREDAAVHPYVHEQRPVRRQRHRREKPHRRDREARARGPGDQPEQATLDQQLPHDAIAAGPHREADRDFPAAEGGPREQQAGYVGAREEQHQANRAGQRRPEGDEGVARQRVHSPFELRQDAEGDAPTGDGVRLLELASENGKGRACLLDHYAGPESSQDEVATLPAVLDPYGHEELRPETDVDPMEAFGRHADDREGLGAQGDRRAEDAGVAAEAAAPEAVAQDDDREDSGLVSQEEAALGRLEAEHREVVAADVVGPHTLLPPTRAEVHGGGLVGQHPGEDLSQAGCVEVVGRSEREVPRPARVSRVKAHQPLRLGGGQRAKQDAVDEREGDHTGADAQGEHEGGGQGKSWLPVQGAQGVP